MRRMVIRAKAQPRTTIHVDLEAGSLLVMDYATQLHYTHAIPKTTDAVGGADQPGVPRQTAMNALHHSDEHNAIGS